MSTPILSSIAILCGGCVDIPLSCQSLKSIKSYIKRRKNTNFRILEVYFSFLAGMLFFLIGIHGSKKTANEAY